RSLSRHVLLFTAPATSECYTLSLHDALPICVRGCLPALLDGRAAAKVIGVEDTAAAFIRGGDAVQCVETNPKSALMSVTNKGGLDRKSTRLNSSHLGISYAVFCLKKKKKQKK